MSLRLFQIVASVNNVVISLLSNIPWFGGTRTCSSFPPCWFSGSRGHLFHHFISDLPLPPQCCRCLLPLPPPTLFTPSYSPCPPTVSCVTICSRRPVSKWRKSEEGRGSRGFFATLVSAARCLETDAISGAGQMLF